mgnify:CR=1 FL=1
MDIHAREGIDEKSEEQKWFYSRKAQDKERTLQKLLEGLSSEKEPASKRKMARGALAQALDTLLEEWKASSLQEEPNASFQFGARIATEEWNGSPKTHMGPR